MKQLQQNEIRLDTEFDLDKNKMFSSSLQNRSSATETPFSNECEIELKELLRNFTLPQVVEIVNGYHGVDEATTLSVGQVLTICALATTDMVLAKDSNNSKLYIPLNCAKKLELCVPGADEYSNVSELAQASPKFACVTQGNKSKKKEKRLNIGDKLQLKRLTKRGTVLECDNQKHERLRLPLNLEARFQPLVDGEEYVLRDFIKSHQLPIWVHFLNTPSDNVAESSTCNFASLGVLKLENIATEEHFVCLSKQGNEHCMLKIPKDTDIRVKVVQQPAKNADKNYLVSDKAVTDDMGTYEELRVEDIYASPSGIRKYTKRKQGFSQTVEEVRNNFAPPLSRVESVDPENIYASLKETGRYTALETVRLDAPGTRLIYSPQEQLQSPAKSSNKPADMPITNRSVTMAQDQVETQNSQEEYECYVSMNEEQSEHCGDQSSGCLLRNRNKTFIFPDTPPQPSPRRKGYSTPFDDSVKERTKSSTLCSNFDKENVPFPFTKSAGHEYPSREKYCRENFANVKPFPQTRCRTYPSECLGTRLPLAVNTNRVSQTTPRHYSASSIEETPGKDSRIKTLKQISSPSANPDTEPTNRKPPPPSTLPRCTYSSSSTAEEFLQQQQRQTTQRRPLPFPRTVTKSTSSVTGLLSSITTKDTAQVQPRPRGTKNKDNATPSPLPRTKRYSCSSVGELSKLNELQQSESSESFHSKSAEVPVNLSQQKRKLSESVFETEDAYERMDNYFIERRKLVDAELVGENEKERTQNRVPALAYHEEYTIETRQTVSDYYECLELPEKLDEDLSRGSINDEDKSMSSEPRPLLNVCITLWSVLL